MNQAIEDIEMLRADIVKRYEASPDASARSIIAAYDLMVPESQRINPSSPQTLLIRSGRSVDSRQTAQLVNLFTRAAANLGQEILHKSPSRLSSTDYEAVPLTVRTPGAGVIILGAVPPSRVVSDETPSTSAQAIDWLARILPGDVSGSVAIQEALGRSPSQRAALKSIATVASRVDGVDVRLRTQGREDARSSMSNEQARALTDILNDASIRETEMNISGRLDGARLEKRLFYLIREGEREISGGVDVEMLPRITSNLGAMVHIRVLRRQRIGIDERPVGHSSYHLLSLDVDPKLPTE